MIINFIDNNEPILDFLSYNNTQKGLSLSVRMIFLHNLRLFQSHIQLKAEATIKCSGCGIVLLAVSRTYSHFNPFPAHIRTTSLFSHFFAQFGASRTVLHNFKYKNQQSIEKWVEFIK